MKYNEITPELNKKLRRDWIITNGIGGFASQNILGINTRKYHGLLIAPLVPPANRYMILSKVDESLKIDGKQYNLFSNISNGYLTEGFKYLIDFKKEYIPIFTYKVEDVIIKKFICMKYGENTVTILYRIKNTNKNVNLTLAPIINFRDFHQLNANHKFIIQQSHIGTKLKIIIDGNSTNPIYLNCSDGKYFKHIDDTFYNMYYPMEKERGFPAEENHSVPGIYDIKIYPNEERDITFVCSLQENIDEIDSINIINKEILRLSEVIYDTGLVNDKVEKNKKDMLKTLIIAADNFIVDRQMFNLHTIIAGYPWFLDWGRDSLISFEGLLLKTKRFEIAKEVLLTNIKDIKFGLIPNGYSGYDNRPLYNSADSSLLFFEQVYKYLEYTEDYNFIKEKIYSELKKIIEGYSSNINVDGDNIYMDKDFLISAGTSNTQITWMDVKIGNKAVTPRNGKTVEINALWYNALIIISKLAHKFNEKNKSKEYNELAQKVKESFNQKFYNKEKECLYDVLGDDRIRPNQLFALSLSNKVIDIDSKVAQDIMNVVKSKLLNNYGLKSLAEGEENYVEVYEGDVNKRDSSYHQGITWTWLLGLYYDSLKAIIKYTRKKEIKSKYEKELEEFKENVQKTFYKEITTESTLGSISEIYDSVKPFKARGAFAQAWSVAEVLRIISED